MDDQVGEETCCPKFIADTCTGVFGGDMPIFQLFLYMHVFLQTAYRLDLLDGSLRTLDQNTQNHARVTQTFGG